MKRAWLLLAAIAAPASAQTVPDPSLEFAFEEIVTLGPAVAAGATPRGARQYIPITGGTFEGPGIKGEIVPGGWDWQLRRADGCTEIEADYFLKTDDGVVINVLNRGVLCPPVAGARPVPVRTHPVFEAPQGKYDWLNRTTFIGTLEGAPPSAGPAVKIRFFKVN
ncbi:MAG: hypothetical protein B7Z08_11510 [Sphingomonadales bacterium 32-68-7]|nr:MAG: hypothetical protein B7Z33_11715 [Sphingomonadales bacterium 12-68-11]OYX07978.1 MAG: hypothetical protein B7Z08_11510 [Sphingomonadales bacterium 32-68-7]